MPVNLDLTVKPVQLPNALEMALQGTNLRNARLQGQNLQQTMDAQMASGQAISNNTDENGVVDYNKAQSDASNNPAAAYGMQDSTAARQAQQTAALEQHGNMLAYSVGQMTPLLNKPDLTTDDIVKEMAAFADKFKIPAPMLAQSMSNIPPKNAPTEVLRNYIRQKLISTLDNQTKLAALTQQVSMQPTIGPNGQPVNMPTNVNPNAGQVGPIPGAVAQPMTLAPGALESIEQDAFGNKHVVSRSPQGAILSTRPLPGSAPVGTPGAFPSVTPGQGADIADAQKEVGSIRAAGDSAPIAANINRKILELSKDATTAPGSDRWQKAMAGLSFGHAGDDYQELGKFLEKNAISAMQTMGGPPSDARLSAATAANGSTQFNPGALQAVTKFNDATTTALSQYRQGVDKAVGLKNSDYTALPTFKSNWAKNFDVDIFRVENAVRDGDKAELSKIAAELGPKKMKELAQKRLNLQALALTGRLP